MCFFYILCEFDHILKNTEKDCEETQKRHFFTFYVDLTVF